MATGNRLLDSLPADLVDTLIPNLEPMQLPRNTYLMQQGSAIEYVYFPTSCLVSLVATIEAGNTVEAATIGPDGFVGISALLGLPALATNTAMVQIEGDALRMPIVAFDKLLEDGRFRRPLGVYALWVIQVISQSAACLAFHPVQERLARWLLMVRNGLERLEFPLTQDFIAVMLGSHRPTVSIAVGALANAGFIENRRGIIRILDEAGLESASCECFAMSRSQLRLD